MKKADRIKITQKAEALKGKRRTRTIDNTEIDIMAKLDRKKSLAGKTIRVYSHDGFVPKSYNKGFFTPIDYIERVYVEGVKKFNVAQAGAQRPNGTGSLITIDGRAY